MIASDRKFLFFNKNSANVMIPSNWSIFKDLIMHSADNTFFYTFLTARNDNNKLRELVLDDLGKNLLFYTINGEIYYEEVLGTNIFPIINKIFKQLK